MTVPDWVTAYIEECKALLRLSDVDVTVELVSKVDNNPRAHGKADTNAPYLYAYLFLRDDIQDNAEWRDTILHEMEHVAQGELLEYIDRVLLLVPYDMRDHLLSEFHSVNEPSIVRNVHAITRAKEAGSALEVKQAKAKV